jgi:hypothetical protein
MEFFLGLFLSVFSAVCIGQPAEYNEFNIFNDKEHQSITIAYDAHDIVYNLLVHISDKSGRTVFLDNRYKFSGNYSRSFDMKKREKGMYYIEIIGDNKHINKQFELK